MSLQLSCDMNSLNPILIRRSWAWRDVELVDGGVARLLCPLKQAASLLVFNSALRGGEEAVAAPKQHGSVCQKATESR